MTNMQNHRKRKRTKKRSNRTPTPVQNRLLGGDTKVTATVSGNAEVFQDMAEEDISEESSDELFNISSVDEGTSTDEDDSSRRERSATMEEHPRAKVMAWVKMPNMMRMKRKWKRQPERKRTMA